MLRDLHGIEKGANDERTDERVGSDGGSRQTEGGPACTIDCCWMNEWMDGIWMGWIYRTLAHDTYIAGWVRMRWTFCFHLVLSIAQTSTRTQETVRSKKTYPPPVRLSAAPLLGQLLMSLLYYI